MTDPDIAPRVDEEGVGRCKVIFCVVGPAENLKFNTVVAHQAVISSGIDIAFLILDYGIHCHSWQSIFGCPCLGYIIFGKRWI